MYKEKVWELITVESIKIVHDTLINDLGGETGVLFDGTIDFIVYELKRKNTAPAQAAHLLHSITTKHPFVDGNKRTAFTLANIVLLIHKYNLIVSQKEKLEFMLSVANYKVTVEQVEEWIKNNAVTI